MIYVPFDPFNNILNVWNINNLETSCELELLLLNFFIFSLVIVLVTFCVWGGSDNNELSSGQDFKGIQMNLFKINESHIRINLYFLIKESWLAFST